MSTSCEPVAVAEVEGVLDFQYPTIPSANFAGARGTNAGEHELRQQRAQATAVEAARQQGISQGERQATEAMAVKLEHERQAIAEAIARFAHEQRCYFRRVESDAVTLALAIARKLLHREAQIDPLLLSGVVRVALEQVQAGSQVVLRVSPLRQETWQRFLSTLPETDPQVTVVADESVPAGKLILEAAAGKAELSLEEKLKEIESGFLDLLHREGEGPHDGSIGELS